MNFLRVVNGTSSCRKLWKFRRTNSETSSVCDITFPQLKLPHIVDVNIGTEFEFKFEFKFKICNFSPTHIVYVNISTGLKLESRLLLYCCHNHRSPCKLLLLLLLSLLLPQPVFALKIIIITIIIIIIIIIIIVIFFVATNIVRPENWVQLSFISIGFISMCECWVHWQWYRPYHHC